MATTFNVLGVCFLLLLSFVQSRHIQNPFGFIQHLEGTHKGQFVKGLKDVKLYLEKYGYFDHDQTPNDSHTMKNHANDDEFDDLLESAIKKYQHMYGLNVTGSLDSDTVKQMMKPRCGVPDFVNRRHNPYHSMSIHFVGNFRLYPGDPRWPMDRTILTYVIRNIPEAILHLDVRSICARAFKKWTDVIPRLTFHEVPIGSDALIEINFHGRQGLSVDDDGFDGPNGTFAHATHPNAVPSFVHFDSDEIWGSIPEIWGVDMESVALHEMGHVLGLGHSEFREAVMYAHFDYGITKRDLAIDDMQGIRYLYG